MDWSNINLGLIKETIQMLTSRKIAAVTFGATSSVILFVAILHDGAMRDIPIWVYFLCSFSLFFFLMDKYEEIKNRKDKNKKKLHEDEKIKKEYESKILFLNNLTEQEKDILKSYIDGRLRAIKFNVDNGAVFELIQKDILYKSTESYFNIKDWAYKYLCDNPWIINAQPDTILGHFKKIAYDFNRGLQLRND